MPFLVGGELRSPTKNAMGKPSSDRKSHFMPCDRNWIPMGGNSEFASKFCLPHMSNPIPASAQKVVGAEHPPTTFWAR